MVKVNVKGPIVTNNQKWLYDYLGMDACAPSDISKALEEADGDDIEVYINSNGGVCTAGFEIYTLLKEYSGKVTAKIIGAAMSAASVIACAADKCLISDAGIYMIHNTQSYAEGDYRDMETEADALKQFNEAIVNVYEKKTGKSREELADLMDNNTYMAAEKAIELGFVDDYMFTVSDSDTEAMLVVNAETPLFTDAMVQKVKKLVLNQEKSAVLPSVNSDLSIKTNKGGNEKMTLEEFLKENPEQQAAVDTMVQGARAEGEAEGARNERARLKELDAIAKSVTAEALEEAKYGEDAKDAKTLAFEAMVDDTKKAASYMAQAQDDAATAKTSEVGATGSKPEAEDKADRLASYANKKKGGK